MNYVRIVLLQYAFVLVVYGTSPYFDLLLVEQGYTVEQTLFFHTYAFVFGALGVFSLIWVSIRAINRERRYEEQSSETEAIEGNSRQEELRSLPRQYR